MPNFYLHNHIFPYHIPLNRNYLHGFKLSYTANIKAPIFNSTSDQVAEDPSYLMINFKSSIFQICQMENIYQLIEMVSIELTGD